MRFDQVFGLAPTHRRQIEDILFAARAKPDSVAFDALHLLPNSGTRRRDTDIFEQWNRGFHRLSSMHTSLQTARMHFRYTMRSNGSRPTPAFGHPARKTSASSRRREGTHIHLDVCLLFVVNQQASIQTKK